MRHQVCPILKHLDAAPPFGRSLGYAVDFAMPKVQSVSLVVLPFLEGQLPIYEGAKIPLEATKHQQVEVVCRNIEVGDAGDNRVAVCPVSGFPVPNRAVYRRRARPHLGSRCR